MWKIRTTAVYEWLRGNVKKQGGPRLLLAHVELLCKLDNGILDHSKLWTILKEMGIPDHLTCLLRNLYAGQEATELDMKQWTGSKLGKEYIKAVYCHPAYFLFNIYAEYIM